MLQKVQKNQPQGKPRLRLPPPPPLSPPPPPLPLRGAVNASIQVYRYLYPESAGRSAARPRSLMLASAFPLAAAAAALFSNGLLFPLHAVLA